MKKSLKILILMSISSLLMVSFTPLIVSCSNNSDDVSTLPTPPSSGSTQIPGTPSLPSGGESTPTPEPTPTPPSSGGGTTSPPSEPSSSTSFCEYYDNYIKMPDGTTFINPILTTLIYNNDNNLSPELQESKKLVEEFGTFPIDINLKDSEVNINHLIKMFDIMAYLRLYKLTFGNRNINAKLVAIAFAQWWISRQKYFPYVVYNNPAREFIIKNAQGNTIINNHIPNNEQSMFKDTWYVKSTENGNYANQWLFPGNEQRDFIDFIARFLQGIDHNMNDIDKLVYSYFYVGSWINYGGGGTLIDTISKHEGVCIQYASLLSFLLNLIGIPSIPMNAANGDLSNKPTNQSTLGPHAITWLYIQPFANKEKQWYCSDATFGDINNLMDLSYSRWIGNFQFNPSDMISNILFCNTIDGPFTPDTNPYFKRWAQYNNNIFFKLPFSMVYDQEYKSEIGSAAIGNETFYNIKSFFKEYSENYNTRSKFFCFNNEWYFIAKSNNSNNFGFYKGNLNSYNVQDISNTIPLEIRNDVLSKPMLLKFNNYFVFNQNDKSFRLHNINDNNWNNDIIVEIDNATKQLIKGEIGEFYIDGDGYINIYNQASITDQGVDLKVKPIKLNKNLYSLIKYDYNSRAIAKIYFDYIAGIKKIKVYDFDFGVDINTKTKFYDDINILYSDNNLTDSQAIFKMKQAFDNLSKSCFNGFEHLGLLNKTNTEIYITKEDYNQFGYKFNVSTWSNPAFENIFDIYRYDIYYSSVNSSNKHDYKCIASNQLLARINKEIKSNPEGYYFIRIYTQNYKQNYIDTEFIHLIPLSCTQSELNDNYQEFFTNAVTFNSTAEGGIRNLTSNFDYKNPNSYNQPIRLEFDINTTISLLNYDIQCSINFINKTTKQISEIANQTLSFPNNRWTWTQTINTIDNQSHGLYYSKITLIDKKTRKVVNTQYSKSSYLFTKIDIDQFNLNEWTSLYSLIR